tara:strand:+ start:309 stop:1727 length:1419 start_codon:yes stop_codon:yes gene_type:complete
MPGPVVYPFVDHFNGRMFYACMGVLVNTQGSVINGRWGRLTQTGDELVQNATFLDGVQSIGVSSDNPSSSLMDVGRFQRKYHHYSEQLFEITIERVIDRNRRFFYAVDPSSYLESEEGYKKCHILHEDNMGCQGQENDNSKSIRNYDITILYGKDTYDRVSNYVPPAERTPSNPTGQSVYSVTYRNCLVTSIGYTMAVGSVITETITLVTKAATYNDQIDTTQYDILNDPSELGPTSAQEGNVLKAHDLDLLNSGPAWGSPPSYSEIPKEVDRMFRAYARDSSGVSDRISQSEGSVAELQSVLGISSIDINIAIDYSEITDVGRWKGSIDQGEQNLWRYVVLPVQVSSSFTGTLRQPYPRQFRDLGDNEYLPNTDSTFSAADGEAGNTDNSKKWQYVDREIKLVAKKFTEPNPNFFVWDLGKRNYLTNFSYSGGDSQGGNLEGTISYQNDTSDIVLSKDTLVRNLPAPVHPF